MNELKKEDVALVVLKTLFSILQLNQYITNITTLEISRD